MSEFFKTDNEPNLMASNSELRKEYRTYEGCIKALGGRTKYWKLKNRAKCRLIFGLKNS